MKTCLVLSDSHGNFMALEAALRQNEGRFDEIIFLGDHIDDVEFLKEKTDRPIHAVKGNCDDRGPQETVLELEGRRLLLTHGDRYGVKFGRLRLSLRARELGVHAVLFGHTHVQEVYEEDGIFYLNPGSIGRPHRGSGTFMLLTVEEKGLTPQPGGLNP